ncbi:MAG: CHRD domain-containing protein [Nitrospiraceae bacterium]|nr:MAG: CHRD domain-containing protein [Nitrospiraceae bacterium]
MKIRSRIILFFGWFFIVCTFAMSVAFAWAESMKSPLLVADLSGREEVPPVENNASGKAEFYLSEGGGELHYRLAISDTANITAAHIHLGSQGENDRVVVVLFDFTSPWESAINSTEIKGVITAANLVGPLVGNDLGGLLREMGAGNTYINVHSEQHPQGHIRGHIVEPSAAGK